jgi:pimaricinolide synthase PimS1
MTRLGVPALEPAEGLALLDRGLATGQAALTAVRLDQQVLRAQAEDLPPVMRGLVRRRTRQAGRAASGPALLKRLATLPPEERARALLDLVRGQVAAVLGHPSQDAIEADRAFQELGFDSLSAVELRKRLADLTGLALPATLVFDHPSSRDVAAELDSRLAPAPQKPFELLLGELGHLDTVLAGFTLDAEEHDLVAVRLEALLRRWRDDGARQGGHGGQAPASSLEGAADDELFQALDRELGIG